MDMTLSKFQSLPLSLGHSEAIVHHSSGQQCIVMMPSFPGAELHGERDLKDT